MNKNQINVWLKIELIAYRNSLHMAYFKMKLRTLIRRKKLVYIEISYIVCAKLEY